MIYCTLQQKRTTSILNKAKWLIMSSLAILPIQNALFTTYGSIHVYYKVLNVTILKQISSMHCVRCLYRKSHLFETSTLFLGIGNAAHNNYKLTSRP